MLDVPGGLVREAAKKWDVSKARRYGWTFHSDWRYPGTSVNAADTAHSASPKCSTVVLTP
jgi:hypothetical protein